MSAREELLERLVRRLVETGGECAAPLMLRRQVSPHEWYEWIYCTRAPGHDRPHADEGDAGGFTAEWQDGKITYSHYVPLDTPCQDPGSPWTAEELDGLIAVAPTEEPK